MEYSPPSRAFTSHVDALRRDPPLFETTRPFAARPTAVESAVVVSGVTAV